MSKVTRLITIDKDVDNHIRSNHNLNKKFSTWVNDTYVKQEMTEEYKKERIKKLRMQLLREEEELRNLEKKDIFYGIDMLKYIDRLEKIKKHNKDSHNIFGESKHILNWFNRENNSNLNMMQFNNLIKKWKDRNGVE